MRLPEKTSLRVLYVLLIVGGVVFTIYYFFFMRMVKVPTGAMANTIVPGDHLLVNRLFVQIERGDIVMFQFPEDPASYVKRVVGLPGETILVRGNTVYINERPLDEQRVMADEDLGDLSKPLKEISAEGDGSYRVFYTQHDKNLSGEAPGYFGTNTPFQIPNDGYFVMGDNRDNSEDSRFRGAVPRELIWGKPAIIYYSDTWARVFKKVR